MCMTQPSIFVINVARSVFQLSQNSSGKLERVTQRKNVGVIKFLKNCDVMQLIDFMKNGQLSD